MLGGGGGAIGQFPLEQWFYEMPVCTRWWTAATVATSLLVQCQIITPFQLFYSFRAVFVKNQVCTRVPNMSKGLQAERTTLILMTMMMLVLAVTHHIRLLRPSVPRSPLPRLLSSAIFQAS